MRFCVRLPHNLSLTAVAGLALFSSGCSREIPPAAFEKNYVFTYRLEKETGTEMTRALEETTLAVKDLFGTPDEPKIPSVAVEDENLKTLVNIDRLKMAAGPIDEEKHTGLYLKHCSICHGQGGEGRGLTAALLDPYPRDYRMGLFKFKTTPRGAKPTRADLAHVIRYGVPGTAMKAFDKLTPEEIDALTDYVIYLSWRGETERALLTDGSDEAVWDAGGLYTPTDKPVTPIEEKKFFLAGTFEESDPLIDQIEEFDGTIIEDVGEKPDYVVVGEKPGEELQKALAAGASQLNRQSLATLLAPLQFQMQQEYINEHVVEIGESWLEAEEKVVEITLPESAVMLTEENKSDPKILASVQRGKELFLGPVAACSKCHGNEGRGDGQATDYDDWSKDWTTRVGIDPKNEQAIVPLIARGALPPRVIRPRNFREGIFRGGDKPEDLYRRILLGIDGTPMPAATMKTDGNSIGLTPEDICDLVNFVKSLAEKESPPQA